MRQRRLPCGYLVVVFSVWAVASAHAQARKAKPVNPNENNAAIVFPAKGNLDVTNGTIEAVFCLAYSFGDQFSSAGSSRKLFSLLSTHNAAGEQYSAANPKKIGSGLSFSVYLSQYQSRDLVYLSSSLFERPRSNHDPVRYVATAFSSKKADTFLKAGAWHSMAATWRLTNETHAVEFFIDGKRVGRGTIPHRTGFSPRSLADDDLLVFGHPGQMYGSLQSVRISGRVRSAAEIAAAEMSGLVKDEATLLLFDGAAVLKMKTGDIKQFTENTSERKLRVPPEGMVFGKLKRGTGRNNAPAVQFREILP